MYQRILQGSLYERVAPELNGQTVEEICDRLMETATPAQVLYTLKRLEQAGYLCEGAGVAMGKNTRRWDRQECLSSSATRPRSGRCRAWTQQP